MKSNSDVRPLVLLNLGDGSWHYNYRIKEVQTVNESGEERTVFEYETVHFWGNPEYEEIARTVIAAHYSYSEEIALINRYNTFALGMSVDPTDKERYEVYLNDVSELKLMIKEDLCGLDY